MKHTISIRGGAIRAGVLAGTLAFTLAFTLMGIAPAAAQFVYWGHRAYPAYAVVPPEDAVASVRSTGLRPVGAPMRHGPAYVMSAIDPAGQELRVVVDARSGRVVRSVPVYVPRYAAMPPNHGRPPGRIPLGPEGDDVDPRIGALPRGDAPPVPGAGPDGLPPPGARSPAARPAPPSAQPAPSAQPTRPPLPRPRPTVASTDSSSMKPASAATKPAAAPVPQATASAPPSAPTAPSEVQPAPAVSAAPPVETEFHE